MNIDTEIKNIVFSTDTTKERKHSHILTQTQPLFKKNNYKEKEKRVITNTNKWDFKEIDFIPENQYLLLRKARELQKEMQIERHNDLSEDIHKEKCLLQELNRKIYGYKNQDILKKLFDEQKFISLEQLLELLVNSNLKCFYCKENVNIIYEPVREPKQWSLERIDNSFGHNNDNVTIACLSCNLRRRTMYHERYVFTKQLQVVKMDTPTETDGP